MPLDSLEEVKKRDRQRRKRLAQEILEMNGLSDADRDFWKRSLARYPEEENKK